VLVVERRDLLPQTAVILTEFAELVKAAVESPDLPLLLCVTAAAEAGSASPIGHAIGAFLNSLQLEHPMLRTRLVSASLDGAEARLADRLTLELADPMIGRDPRPVLYRDQRRHVGQVVPLPAPSHEAIGIRARGAYLLVGGGGEVGRRLALAMSRRYGARIGIIGRRPEVEVAVELAELRAGGCIVAYASADAADAGELRRALRHIRERIGPLNGALHLARQVEDAPFETKSGSSIARVLAPKVAGTLALLEALEADRLDWIALFSSLGAWAGLAGSADYAAACAFQDGLAEARTNGTPILSIAWPQWSYDRHLNDAKRRFWAGLGLAEMDADVGIDALIAAVAGGGGSLAVLHGRAQAVDTLVDRLGRAAERPAEPSAATGIEVELSRLEITDLRAYRDYLKGRRSSAAAVPEVDLARKIAEICGDYLKLPADAVRARPFADQGLDSIKALRLAERLQRELGRPVEPAMLFEHPTVPALAMALERRAGVANPSWRATT
jgi:aryl carrier-like protein